jgi:hypothetical protein
LIGHIRLDWSSELNEGAAEMVDAVTAISNSAATPSVQVDRSLSITSEPDNKWVAARQSQIDADQVALKQANAELLSDIARFADDADNAMEVCPDGHPHKSRDHGHPQAAVQEGDEEPAKLSGESESIGTVDFDDDAPFGHRTAFL